MVEDEADAQEIADAVGYPVAVGEKIEEDACLPPHYLDLIRQKFGRPCPRVELDPENEDALKIVLASVNPDVRAVAGQLTDTLLEGLTPSARRATMLRVYRTLTNEAIVDLLHPKRDG